MADLQEAVVTLPSAPASVSAARRYVCDRLAEWGLPSDAPALDSVRLIVSELATNAVLHTCGRSPEFTVLMRLEHSERLHIGVRDRHPRWPRLQPADEPGEACPLADFDLDPCALDPGDLDPGAGYGGDPGAGGREDGGRGMVIVGHLADESGGALRITPTEEGGKTVWIVLPWTVRVL
ncbi:ATP-binding protein [Actinacidiphila yeochonensis]|uniref:ATP-binding protein n=1 Tax=Actinacidiphila yeochonensis TaxID=89050 RepID=UPI00055A1778|nr:ATP-binding protein [Actinacidiphila yeochonensis]